ncbi:LAFA_0B01200g1_1 [Lachancea sp. 'fantastica']|nr:LAFA_0B01200g1_1 [Lachancea sp. 'fantastica']
MALENLEDRGVFSNGEHKALEKYLEKLLVDEINFESIRRTRARGKNFRYNSRYHSGGRFRLTYTDADFRKLTGFSKFDLDRIVKALKIPSNIGSYSLDAFECFFIFIVRMRSGCTYTVLTSICGREPTTISKIITFMTCYLFHIVSPSLSVANAPWLASRLSLIDQSLLRSNKSVPNSRIVGFIDGTHVKIARPHGSSELQNSAYSGHKKTHILKYQAVTTPDGTCIDLAGPFAGSQHDSFLLANSGLYGRLKPALKISSVQYRIYGDPAYRSSDVHTVGFKGQNLTAAEKNYNKTLAKSRVSIEWFFGAVKNNFQIFNALGKLKVGRVRFCGAYFTIAVFLTNLKHCLEGSQGSKYFGIDPPSFEEFTSRLKFPKYFDNFIIDNQGEGTYYSRQYEHLSFDQLENLA